MRPDTENAILALIGAQWWNEQTGMTEAPTGAVTLIDLATDRDIMRDSVLDDDDERAGFDELAPGFYVIREDDHGFMAWDVFATETEARKEFDRLAHEFEQWDTGYPNPTDG